MNEHLIVGIMRVIRPDEVHRARMVEQNVRRWQQQREQERKMWDEANKEKEFHKNFNSIGDRKVDWDGVKFN
jgi:hypothetical protein